MATDRIDAIHALLVETEKAHGRFEETELHGVYDQAWPRWYAAYAVEHGIGELVGHAISADRLAAFLATSNAEFAATMPTPSDPWPVYTARRVAAEL